VSGVEKVVLKRRKGSSLAECRLCSFLPIAQCADWARERTFDPFKQSTQTHYLCYTAHRSSRFCLPVFRTSLHRCTLSPLKFNKKFRRPCSAHLPVESRLTCWLFSGKNQTSVRRLK
jgi:hypothetical protein